MQTHHDLEALVLLATLMAAKRRPASLVEVMAAIDLIHGSIPAVGKLKEVFASLGTAGLLLESEGGYALTAQAQPLVADLPKKSELAEQVALIRARLATRQPGAEGAPIQLAVEQFSAAINAHRASGQGAGKNLLMPKPKPEGAAKRPGQRQRRPLPARRRKD